MLRRESARLPFASAGMATVSCGRILRKRTPLLPARSRGNRIWRARAQTVRREFHEEITAELTDVRYRGMLENIYEVEGECAHQIVLVYDGHLSDGGLYKKDVIQGDELGQPFQAVWKRLDRIWPGKTTLFIQRTDRTA